MSLSDRLAQAFTLAFELHRHQHRRGGEIPYCTHLMAVAAIVGEHGGTEDQMIAALLHDAMEDQGGLPTLARIRDQFGERVAGYVEGCSDAIGEPKPPWQERKEAFLQQAAAASPDVKLIVAADKLHNTQSIIRDLRHVGPAVWKRFKGGQDGTLWYYAEVVRALAHDWAHPLLEELAEAVDALHRAAHAAQEKSR